MVGTVPASGLAPGRDLESVSEYKRGLYDKLYSTGILDNLKSHLRTRILSKLSGRDKVGIARASRGNEGLISRVLDSLFTDYLRQNGYDYTLSVFLPESGLQSSSSLTLGEILDMLHIDKTSQMGQVIEERHQREEDSSDAAPSSSSSSCLSTLILGSIAQVHSSKPLHEAETQTWDLQGDGRTSSGSVAIEVQRIEGRLQDKLESDRATMKAIFEQKTNDYRRDVEIRSRADVQAQVERVRDIETRSIRIQESAKAWEALAKEKEELDKLHNDRLAALKASELETMQRITEKWRSVEHKEVESRAEIARQRDQIGMERERFEIEIAEKRTHIERREKALDDRTSAAQVKQIEAEKLLDFAAQQLEQARLLKVRTLDVATGGSGRPGQPSTSPEIAMEMLTAARKDASDLRRKLIERVRENEDLREQIRELKVQSEALMPRETLFAERRAWQQERETLLMRETTWQSALQRANAAVDEATNAQEEALDQLEEEKVKASTAQREATDLRAYARELQLAFDTSAYHQHRARASSPGGAPRIREDPAPAVGSIGLASGIDVRELEEVERGLRSRLESFKARSSWSDRSAEASPQPLLSLQRMPPPSRSFQKAEAPLKPEPQAEVDEGERDYVRESQEAMAATIPSYISGAMGSTLQRDSPTVSSSSSPSAGGDLPREASPESPEAAPIPRELGQDPRSSPQQKGTDPGKSQIGSKTEEGALATGAQIQGESSKSTEADAQAGGATRGVVTETTVDLIEVPQGGGSAAEQASPIPAKTEEPSKAPASASPLPRAKTPAKEASASEGRARAQTDTKKASPKTAPSPKKSKSPKRQSPSPSKLPKASQPKKESIPKKVASPGKIAQSAKPSRPSAEAGGSGKAKGGEDSPAAIPKPRAAPEQQEEGPKTKPPPSPEKEKTPTKATGGASSAQASPLNPAAKPYTKVASPKDQEPTGYQPSWSPKKTSPKPMQRKTPPPQQQQKRKEEASPAKKTEGGERGQESPAKASGSAGQSTSAPQDLPVPSVVDPSPKISEPKDEEQKREETPVKAEAEAEAPAPRALPASETSSSDDDREIESPHIAPFRSPTPTKTKIEPERARLGAGGTMTMTEQILTQAAMREDSASEDAEEVDSDINSEGSLSPRHSSGDSFGLSEPGVMGILPTEAPELESPAGGGGGSELDINYSELEAIQVAQVSEEEDDDMSIPEMVQSEEMSVASFSEEGSNLSIPGLSSEGSVF